MAENTILLLLMTENTVLLFLFVSDGREYIVVSDGREYCIVVSDCSFVPMDRTVKIRHTSDQQPSLYKASHSSLVVSFINCHNSHPSMYQPCIS